jgi:hypothetical protein
MAMGLTAVAELDWLEFGSDHGPQIAERRSLLRDRPGDVLACLPEATAAAAELRDTLVAHLLRHHGDRFTREGDRVRNVVLGRDIDVTGDPLAVCGHLVQEDFCLMQPHDDGYRLTGAVLCFPSRWRLADKIGRALPGVHAPVPFYGERLASPVERFFRSLKAGRIAQRLNWSVMDDAALFQPGGHGETDVNRAVTAANALSRLYLRVERQTFRRLPASGAVVFGIRIHVTDLATVAREPGEGPRLRAALAALPEEMQRYKSAGRFSAALIEALA